MGADQFLLPHLGQQARILLDRIVGSGDAGVDRRDTDDWVLSRLIELRYVEESIFDDMVFVCTPAGRHRWQIEVLADEERHAAALRRQIIRRRLDERFTSLGLETSTALTTIDSPAEPPLPCGVPTLWNPPQRTKMRLSSALVSVFAATAAALMVISASMQPQEVRDWLLSPTWPGTVVRADQPKAVAKQTVLVAAPAAAPVAAPVNTVAPSQEKGDVDITYQVKQEVSVPSTKLAQAEAAGSKGSAVAEAVAPAAAPVAAPVNTVAPSQKKEDVDITYQVKQEVSVPSAKLAQAEVAGSKGSAVADAASPGGGAILNWRANAAVLIDAAANESGQIATEVAASVERGFQSIAAGLQHAVANMNRTVSAQEATTEPPSAREPPVTLQPELAAHVETVSARTAIVHITPSEPVTAKGPTARSDKEDVDPQHAAVERLNALSLAAARQGEAWRPTKLSAVAASGRRP